MAKPSDFYVSALDFFGSLLPGAVTLGAALALAPARFEPLCDTRLSDGSKVAAFVVGAYVVGQVASGVGSLFLDLYDRLYAPKNGWLCSFW